MIVMLLDVQQLGALYWKGQWLTDYLQRFWQALPCPAVISEDLAREALSKLALAEEDGEIEWDVRCSNGAGKVLCFGAYWLPQWQTEVQLEWLTGSWTLREDGARPAPVEVLYLGRELRKFTAYAKEHGHFPKLLLPLTPEALHQAAWTSWLEEVRALPAPPRRSGRELLEQFLIPNCGASVEKAPYLDEGLKEKALRFVCPEAVQNLPQDMGQWIGAVRAIDEKCYGLEFVEVRLPSYGLTLLFELKSGYFLAQMAGEQARQLLNELVSLRGYTPEEAANDEGIVKDFAASQRHLLWAEE